MVFWNQVVNWTLRFSFCSTLDHNGKPLPAKHDHRNEPTQTVTSSQVTVGSPRLVNLKTGWAFHAHRSGLTNAGGVNDRSGGRICHLPLPRVALVPIPGVSNEPGFLVLLRVDMDGCAAPGVDAQCISE